jgi:hypothetical protein
MTASGDVPKGASRHSSAAASGWRSWRASGPAWEQAAGYVEESAIRKAQSVANIPRWARPGAGKGRRNAACPKNQEFPDKWR